MPGSCRSFAGIAMVEWWMPTLAGKRWRVAKLDRRVLGDRHVPGGGRGLNQDGTQFYQSWIVANYVVLKSITVYFLIIL
jgi:hypothetical protein